MGFLVFTNLPPSHSPWLILGRATIRSAKAAEESKAEASADVNMDAGKESSSAPAEDGGKVKILGLGRGKKGGKVVVVTSWLCSFK